MEKNVGWQPSASLALASDEVHTWLASLAQPPDCVRSFQATLAPDEQQRAARFYFEKDRRRFIVARGILRALLGHYLQAPAAALSFAYNAYGKPSLRAPASQPALCFNLSHSHELALYAFTYERTLGVDIEYMRDLTGDDYLRLAQLYFSPGEYATLRALPASLHKQAFFHCWTRKEAYIKTRGMGVSIPLNSFDVSFAPGAPAALLGSRDAPYTVAAWQMTNLTVPSDYAAALLVAGHDWHSHMHAWGQE